MFVRVYFIDIFNVLIKEVVGWIIFDGSLFCYGCFLVNKWLNWYGEVFID